MKYGDILKQLRNEMKLSQQELSKRLNINRSTYARYETSSTQPDYDTLQKLADFFDVSVDYLLGRTDDPGINNRPPATELTEKDERDIAKRMEKLRKDLMEGNADGDGLSFHGEPMSEEAIESILSALEHAERTATLINKKYVPKKYRKEKKDE